MEKPAEVHRERIPIVVFAYLLGSAADTGVVNAGSDLDLALYLSEKPDFPIFTGVQEICDECAGSWRDNLC